MQMRDIVRQLAQLFPTAIISGRGRDKLEGFVKLKEMFYAGSHGLDIVGPRVCPLLLVPVPVWSHCPLCSRSMAVLCLGSLSPLQLVNGSALSGVTASFAA